MFAVFKRELKSYFTTAIGYTFLAIFWFFSGFYFLGGVILQNTTDMSIMFESLFIVVMLLIPILTMRLFSEEYKENTYKLLFSSPIKLRSIVLGKYFAALILYIIACSITILYALVVAIIASVSFFVLLGSILGLLLLGMALISIGIFVSTLTESQVVSAILAFGLFLLFMYLDSFAQFISVSFIKNILTWISFMGKYRNFISGILNISDLFYFLSISAVFIFLSIRVLEKKRLY